MIKSIEEADIKEGTRVFVRVDWNVPVTEGGEVADGSRIEVSLPTIEYIKSYGGIPIIASHFGRKGELIEPVIDFARKSYPLLRDKVEFLENLRKDKREEANDESFAKELADKANIYINDAFSVSHRKHASIVGTPKFLPHFAGFRFLEEYNKISECFNPEHPFLLILGGAKFETKLPLVQKFLDIADIIFIGGKNTSEAQNLEIAQNPKIIFPIGDIDALDANTETLEILKEEIDGARFVLWNGPLGKYEDGHIAGTVALARLLAESSAKVIVGGGDTEHCIDDLRIEDKFYFISLAGGAMLEFLASGTLPGIEALEAVDNKYLKYILRI